VSAAEHDSRPGARGFELLLGRLTPQRSDAARRFDELRTALTRYFLWRRCEAPEDLADETITRVARKFEGGEEVGDVYAYAHGVARLVLLEALKESQRREAALQEMASLPHPEPADEERLRRLDGCLATLAAGDRALLVGYYGGERSAKIENRKRLAEAQGLSLSSLRVRVHRLRARVEQCLVK
jgi:RNA polymerase sigma factor (sigma-70 family)